MRDGSSGTLKIAVGIATRGRAAVLQDTIADLSGQTRPPDSIIVAYAEESDVGDGPQRFPQVTFVKSALGLTRQRNAILERVTTQELVIFLDDDFYLAADYLARMERLFAGRPEVNVATGQVLADGINGPGLSLTDAKAVLSSAPLFADDGATEPAFNAYGCNMALRTREIVKHGLRFDENLPLYGWYEDVDFSRRLAPYGEIVLLKGACGVHLGSKSGRQSGLRLGYSQVANPAYLASKKSVSWVYAGASMVSRTMKNLVRSVKPEPYVDRLGRLRGNLIGWRDLVTGRIDPRRIMEM